MSHPDETPPVAVPAAMRPLPIIIFGSRWLQLPLYLGLIVAQCVYVFLFIIGGYETFVSRLNLQDHPDQPEWLSHVNASVLKIKLAMAIIGISSIHLLRTFIEAGNIGSVNRATDYTVTGVILQTVIHVVFILSAIGIAWVDKMTVPAGKAH
jgi:uncharacterized protein (TIGR00645 family)